MKIFQQKIGLLTLPSKMHLCMTFWKAFLKRKWRFLHQVWKETAIREACLPVYPVIERTLVAQFPLSSFPSSPSPLRSLVIVFFLFNCGHFVVPHKPKGDFVFLITSGNLNFRFFFLRCRVCVKQQNKKAIQLLAHLSEILTCNLQPATCSLHRPRECQWKISVNKECV